MIKISIHNFIKIDGQSEQVLETYQGELQQLAGKTCLLYQNELDQKVLLKFDSQELQMIRYMEKPMKMVFQKNAVTALNYPGLGPLSVVTENLQVDLQQQKISLTYALLQQKSKVGDYRMKISWQ